MSEESLALCKELGDKSNTMSLNRLGDVAFRQGDYDRATNLFEQSVEVCRTAGQRGNLIISLYKMGGVALACGNLERAIALYEESLTVAGELGSRWDIGGCLEAVAGLAAHRGQYERSAVLLGAVERLFEGIGFRVRPDDRAELEHKIVVRAHLKAEIFEAALAGGRTLNIEQAMAEARQATLRSAPDTPAVPVVGSAHASRRDGLMPRELDALTPRELEVLRLVARGLTDSQVADLLVISRRTVGGHLASIYSKLDVTTRTAAARYAMDRKLV